MRKALVAIGVDKTATDFPLLKAAALGASQMADWGRQQGFDVTLLSDSGGKEVLLGDVYKAIAAIVKLQVYKQLVVYFSGHGILLSPDTEVWLLSGALDSPNEAINVSGSIVAARTCGIEHVVFVSDACRSMPVGFRMGMVSPGVVFPTRTPKPPLPEVDVFYATLPGDPALEVPPDEAESSFRGLLTGCLLTALKGSPSAVVDKLNDAGTLRRVVASRPLKAHLIQAVPDAASAVSIKLVQNPDVRVESALPKYLAELSTTTGDIEEADPSGGEFLSSTGSAKPEALSLQLTKSWKASVWGAHYQDLGPIKVPEIEGLRTSVDNIVQSVGRRSFETRTGFTVHGIPVLYAKTTGDIEHCDIFRENGASQVRTFPEFDIKRLSAKRATLIRLADGSGLVLPVLTGYIGTVSMENGHVSTVNFTPSKGTPNYDIYDGQNKDIEERRAFAAVAARYGSFRLDAESAIGTAEYLRSFKKIDPTLGMYAAYAYAQAGNSEGVLSIFKYMAREPEPVLFDVGMLAIQRDANRPQVLDFAPWMPLLTQGWMLLGDFEEAMPQVLREARKHLLPGLWTTFAPEGVDILEQAMFGRIG